MLLGGVYQFSMLKIVYFVAEDWYFCSHRLALAQQALAQGYQVSVITRCRQHADQIRQLGFNLIHLELRRGGINPLVELSVLRQLLQHYQRIKPDLVHHVALKPVLYGSIAAKIAGVPHVINALAGLGYVFTSKQLLARLLKLPIKLLIRQSCNQDQNRVIVQNPDDAALLSAIGVARKQICLIRGSGVDATAFFHSPVPSQQLPVLMFVARMLWSKGIGELMQATKQLHAKGLQFCLRLVGSPDPENPDSITEQDLQTWQQYSFVDYLGARDDIAELWQSATIAVLPSYREGLPKALLEAASCGRPIITTDTPGCREVVTDGDNGLLVPVADIDALSHALERLLLAPELCQQMGNSSRQRVSRYFADEIIIKQTMQLYQELSHG